MQSTQWAHLLPPPTALSSDRPFVTLSFAQSLDGSIATSRKKALPLSGQLSMQMTHALRAASDTIMVGVGTILSDDPQLNARFPVLSPKQPQPVVLDPQLRFPLSARLLKIATPIIYCNEPANPDRQAELEKAGAIVIALPRPHANGGISEEDLPRLDVGAALRSLRQRGVNSVMIEGGATIIGQLMQSDFVDRIVVTITPLIVGGLRISLEPQSTAHGGGLFRRLQQVRYDVVGEDIIVSGLLQPKSDMLLPAVLHWPNSNNDS